MHVCENDIAVCELCLQVLKLLAKRSNLLDCLVVLLLKLLELSKVVGASTFNLRIYRDSFFE